MQVKKQQWNQMWRSSLVQIGKGEWQGVCMLSPCIFNSYAEYIMWNVGLNDSQAEIKIAGRNIFNFRCADGTTLMARK